MRRSTIASAATKCLLLLFPLLSSVSPAFGQQSWPATVTAEMAPVYRDMTTESTVLTTLSNGSQVTVFFAVRSVQGSWCKIALQDDRQNYGFVYCSQLHRELLPSSKTDSGASAAGGTPASQECRDLVDGLMASSGADADFLVITKDLIAAISSHFGRGFSPQEHADLTAIMQRDMDGLLLSADVHHGLLSWCDPPVYSAALDTFKLPLVAQMVKLETAPGAIAYHTSVSPERSALFRQLDRAQGNMQVLLTMMTDSVAIIGTTWLGAARRKRTLLLSRVRSLNPCGLCSLRLTRLSIAPSATRISANTSPSGNRAPFSNTTAFTKLPS